MKFVTEQKKAKYADLVAECQREGWKSSCTLRSRWWGLHRPMSTSGLRIFRQFRASCITCVRVSDVRPENNL